MDKISQECFEDEIPMNKIKFILSYKFRMGHRNLNRVLSEMKNLGLIKYKTTSKILVLWKPKN